nr:MAG TPA: hypothetical protein [Caudoviricetes sp.]
MNAIQYFDWGYTNGLNGYIKYINAGVRFVSPTGGNRYWNDDNLKENLSNNEIIINIKKALNSREEIRQQYTDYRVMPSIVIGFSVNKNLLDIQLLPEKDHQKAEKLYLFSNEQEIILTREGKDRINQGGDINITLLISIRGREYKLHITFINR